MVVKQHRDELEHQDPKRSNLLKSHAEDKTKHKVHDQKVHQEGKSSKSEARVGKARKHDMADIPQAQYDKKDGRYYDVTQPHKGHSDTYDFLRSEAPAQDGMPYLGSDSANPGH